MMISIGFIIGLVVGLFVPTMGRALKRESVKFPPFPRDLGRMYADVNVYTAMSQCNECGLKGERKALNILKPCPDCGGDVSVSRPARWAAPMKGMDMEWIEKPKN